MPLTTEQKADRSRQRMLEKALEYTTGTYLRRFVATVFQQLVRAEEAAKPEGHAPAVVGEDIRQVFRQVGQCVCVTCGKVGAWKGDSIGGGTIETGHFLASRRASILLEPTNAHPQCKFCNRHLNGNQGAYELWMRHVYGQGEIDRLRRVKNETKQFTRDQLVDLKLQFAARLKAATELCTVKT